MKKTINFLKLSTFLLVIIGLIDTSYLTHKYFFEPYAACFNGPFSNCGAVLNSKYSVFLGIPLAVLGLMHYLWLTYLMLVNFKSKKGPYKRFIFIQTAIGVIFSTYLTYLQFFVIKALCPYCLLSALISFSLYFLVRYNWKDDYRSFVLAKVEIAYKLFAKPLFFVLSPDWVHDQAMFWGEIAGQIPLKRYILSRMFLYKNSSLKQKIAGINFENPIGLSAGYDYKASFVQILPSIGFGFETVGTITNEPCQGNEKPRLGRLPESQSLLVNKGFRNPGAEAIIDKLKKRSFHFPFGISIGRTNSLEIAGTQKSAISDIVSSFKKFEKSKVKNLYYELNISCPNLKGGVSFYPPKELNALLIAVGKLKIKKPVFVKMPIEKSDAEVKEMLDIIAKFKWINGVIIGNLQKNRKDPSFINHEITSAGVGNFSGKPTFRRSNELIRLAYRDYGKRFTIIGCGGVFNAEDAYRKIRYGASLIQLITGMIFEGPQRISQINQGLVELLQSDGYSNISEAVGVDA